MRKTQLLGTMLGVAAGSIATFNVTTDRSYHQIILETKGIKRSDITLVKVLVNGREQRALAAYEIDRINRAYGNPTSPEAAAATTAKDGNYFYIAFERPNLLTREMRELTSLYCGRPQTYGDGGNNTNPNPIITIELQVTFADTISDGSTVRVWGFVDDRADTGDILFYPKRVLTTTSEDIRTRHQIQQFPLGRDLNRIIFMQDVTIFGDTDDQKRTTVLVPGVDSVPANDAAFIPQRLAIQKFELILDGDLLIETPTALSKAFRESVISPWNSELGTFIVDENVLTGTQSIDTTYSQQLRDREIDLRLIGQNIARFDMYITLGGYTAAGGVGIPAWETLMAHAPVTMITEETGAVAGVA